MTALFRCIAALLFAASSAALAQYPDKPIRLVVPFPAGGSTDVAARAIAQAMSQSLGQTVVIENKPGADGVIAGEAVAKAAPDGYSFLFGTATGMSYAPAVRKTMPYDPVSDFTPLGRVGYFTFFVYVPESFPVRTLGDLVSFARSNPGKVNYGSTSATSLVAAALFAQAEKLDMVHVPYKGDAPMLVDLLAGRIQATFAAGAALPHVKEGKLRALGTMLPARTALLPDVPTFTEAGFASVAIAPWAGLFGPANLPRDVAARISRELANALARPEVREQLTRLALDARSSTTEEFSALVKDQLVVWRKATQMAKIAPE